MSNVAGSIPVTDVGHKLSILLDVVSDFGAVGDDVHDDTANIQAAINALKFDPLLSPNQERLKVVFPQPKVAYKITDNIDVPRLVGGRIIGLGMVEIKQHGNGKSHFRFR